jgi:hypothetical protein
MNRSGSYIVSSAVNQSAATSDRCDRSSQLAKRVVLPYPWGPRSTVIGARRSKRARSRGLFNSGSGNRGRADPAGVAGDCGRPGNGFTVSLIGQSVQAGTGSENDGAAHRNGGRPLTFMQVLPGRCESLATTRPALISATRPRVGHRDNRGHDCLGGQSMLTGAGPVVIRQMPELRPFLSAVWRIWV